MSVPTPKREKLPKNLHVTAISSPKSLLAEDYHRISAQARPLMLADLDKYRYERHKQRSLSTTSKTAPSTGSGHESVPVPPRGTERYCAWRCKNWENNRYEGVCGCECGFEHKIVHPSEWKTTPAEAEWDYGLKNGGYRYRQRKVRFADPVVTDVEVVESWVCEAAREGDWEWVEKEDVETEVGGVAVDLGSEMGGVGEDPDEEMEDVFEYLYPDLSKLLTSRGLMTRDSGERLGDKSKHS